MDKLQLAKIDNGIKHSMREEKQAIDNYTKRMNYAEKCGDLKTARLYAHIIRQEKEHYWEFQKQQIKH